MVSQNSINNTVQDNDFSVNRATAGTTVQSSVDHSDNTSTTSHAKFLAQVGGTSGGDPHFNVNIPATQDYALGIDNTDADNLKLTDGADPSSGNTYMTFDQATTDVWLDGVSFNAGTDVMSVYDATTWTPSMTFGGTDNWTFGTQVGRYTQIGRVVFCQFEISITVVGAAVGAARLTGLPFSVLSSQCNGGVRPNLIVFSASYFHVTVDPVGGGTTAALIETGDNNAFLSLDDASFQVNSSLAGQFIYIR